MQMSSRPFLSGPESTDRLRLLLRVPNHDYYLVYPRAFTSDYEEEEDAGCEDPCALVCFMCSKPNDDNCRCREAMDAYGQVECLSCFCDYRRQFRSPRGAFWSEPCGCCIPAYRADYVAHMATISAARARLADLCRQAEELAPVFLALPPAEQAALLEECGSCNIVVRQTLDLGS